MPAITDLEKNPSCAMNHYPAPRRSTPKKRSRQIEGIQVGAISNRLPEVDSSECLEQVAALLSGGGFAPADATQHLIGRGPADQFLGDFRIAFLVAGQSTMGGQPGQRSLDDPSSAVDGESALVGRLAHDIDHHGQRAGGSLR
ncbi:hypothetical protein ACQP2X_25705 [Actinoplanes sp. CA-131856]